MDKKKLNAIIAALTAQEGGLWIREIARRTLLDPRIVKYYIEKYPELFDIQTIGSGKPVFTLVKLKRSALTKAALILANVMREVDGSERGKQVSTNPAIH
jgi:hypothetical protein